MVLVLVLDGIAYLLAVNTRLRTSITSSSSVLADIFVAVALLTISVGLVLPGMITYSATEVSKAAKRLTSGTLRDFSHAMARARAAATSTPRMPRSTSCRSSPIRATSSARWRRASTCCRRR